jgi:hypothetical protein
MNSIYNTLHTDLVVLANRYQLKNLRSWLFYDNLHIDNTRTVMKKCVKFCCDEEDWSDFEKAIDSPNHWLWRDEVIWTCIKHTFKGKSIEKLWNWDTFGEWYNVDIYLTFVAIITHRVAGTEDEYGDCNVDPSRYLETFGEAVEAYRAHMAWLEGSIKNRTPF